MSRPGPGPTVSGGGAVAAEPLTVAFTTLGCKLNQYDTTELQALLEARGFRTVSAEEPARLYVVNTCTVTARADQSDRQAIRRAVARNPDALVVVTGCYAQTNPDAIARMAGVDLVLGTGDRHALPDLLGSLVKGAPPLVRVGDAFAERPRPAVPLRRFAPGYTRAFVKVQDGCQHRCSFCIVPFARGGSRSHPMETVVEQVEALVGAGYQEVVLTGVDLGHYGWDLVPRGSLAGLVRRLLDVPGLGRLRLSSILPAYFTDALIETIAGSPRICRHLHVPLQAGADRVLRAMRRPYTVGLYRRLCERLVATRRDLGLGTDVITGFPGETDAEFAETEALCADLPFTYLHVFSYSDRRGTEAARLPAPRVPPDTIRRRTARLRRLGAAKQAAFRQRHLGCEVEALVLGERDRAPGRQVGLTDNYLEVAFEAPEVAGPGFVRLRITGADGEGLRGDLSRAHEVGDAGANRGGGRVGAGAAPGAPPQAQLMDHA